MDMPADFTLKTTLPPSSGKGAAMSISVMPGYQSGQRLASLKSAMVSCGEALIWTLRCTIAIVDLPALCCRTPFRHARSLCPRRLLLGAICEHPLGLIPHAWSGRFSIARAADRNTPASPGEAGAGRAPRETLAARPDRRLA